MKFLFLSSLCIVYLSACSIRATGTAVPTQTAPPISTQAQLSTSASISTNTETPTVTLAGLKYCVVPNLLNLRSGPGLQYSIVVIEGQGTCLQAIARNEDASWVYINTGKYAGWAYVQYLSGQGDLTTLPLIAELTLTPPAVTQTPVVSPIATP